MNVQIVEVQDGDVLVFMAAGEALSLEEFEQARTKLRDQLSTLGCPVTMLSGLDLFVIRKSKCPSAPPT